MTMLLDKYVTKLNKTLVILFLVIVLLQWAHFVLYFNQDIIRSLVWSFTDWSVWFALFVTTLIYLYKHKTIRKSYLTAIGVCFIILSGPAQILLSSLFYQLIFDSDKALFQSLIHMMNKRWLQNLFIATIFALIGAQLLNKLMVVKKEKNEGKQVSSNITFFDGKVKHRLCIFDIFAITSTKNYISVFTENKEIVVRSTLKSIRQSLPEDNFTQISRSTIINKSTISQLEKYSRASYRVILNNNYPFNVSKRFLPELQTLLNN